MKTFSKFIREGVEISYLSSLVSEIESTISAFKEYHWNISGEGFLQIHELFGEIYDELGVFQDRIAEKARVSGIKVILSPSTVDKDYDVNSALRDSKGLLEKLKGSVEALCSITSDPSVENILGEFAEKLDSFIYKVSSSIK